MIFRERAPRLKGRYTLDVYEGDIVRSSGGVILNNHLEHLEYPQLIVTVGKQMMLDRLYGLSAVGAMSRIGVGTSATAAALGNTGLTGGVFVAHDSTPTRSSLTVTAQSTFGTGTANIAWAELACDNGTTILNRLIIGPITKSPAIAIIVQYALTQA